MHKYCLTCGFNHKCFPKKVESENLEGMVMGGIDIALMVLEGKVKGIEVMPFKDRRYKEKLKNARIALAKAKAVITQLYGVSGKEVREY